MTELVFLPMFTAELLADAKIPKAMKNRNLTHLHATSLFFLCKFSDVEEKKKNPKNCAILQLKLKTS